MNRRMNERLDETAPAKSRPQQGLDGSYRSVHCQRHHERSSGKSQNAPRLPNITQIRDLGYRMRETYFARTKANAIAYKGGRPPQAAGGRLTGLLRQSPLPLTVQPAFFWAITVRGIPCRSARVGSFSQCGPNSLSTRSSIPMPTSMTR
jgi:hypothetical protein